MSVEHCLELLQGVEAIQNWHVYVQENERNWVQRFVTGAIIDIDVAEQDFKRFNDVLAIICGYELIGDSQVDEISLERLNVYELIVCVDDPTRLAIIIQQAMPIEGSQESE